MEVSIGDYVLSGGEMAAQVLIDAVVRLLDGVMGNPDAHHQDSFENGLLEHPFIPIRAIGRQCRARNPFKWGSWAH